MSLFQWQKADLQKNVRTKFLSIELHRTRGTLSAKILEGIKQDVLTSIGALKTEQELDNAALQRELLQPEGHEFGDQQDLILNRDNNAND